MILGQLPGQLALYDVLAGVNSRVELGDEDLDLVSEPLLERVQGADMVPVAVGERYAADAAAGACGSRDELDGGATGRRVDHRVNPSSSRTR